MKSQILCVGLCCLDIVSELDKFPSEDSDQRCAEQWWQRGGNASNNGTVLSIIGAETTFLGTVADDHLKSFLLDDFASYGINANVILHPVCICPTSCVILSQKTCSRTIIHSNKNLPEVSIEDFVKLDLAKFGWIHFEGRNVAVVTGMIGHIRAINMKLTKPITISVEIEKCKPELESLIALADVVFISRDFAQFRGHKTMSDALHWGQTIVQPMCTIVCAWGAEGASAWHCQTGIVFKPASSPGPVVDTLGAGDTFTAAVIYALISEVALGSAIEFGCRVAGAKVGIRGWKGFGNLLRELKILPV